MSAGEGAGVVDVHNHLVPGVDDGARTVADALAGIERMVAAGVRRIATTPHLDASLAEDRRALDARVAAVERAWQPVREEAATRYPELALDRGFEILLDVPDPHLTDARLRLAGTRFALVEWRGPRLPRGTVGVLAGLTGSGIVPVVAHPERYALGRDVALAEDWRAAGALLQVNHGSLHGRYGKEARARALALLREGWVDLMASDFHGRAHLSTYVEETRNWFQRHDAEGIFQELTTVNPGRILNDEMPMPVPPLDVPLGPLERIRSFLNLDGVQT